MLNSPEMKTFWTVLVIFVSLIILALTTFFLIGYFKPKPAGIYIDSNPASAIYINGFFIGRTPYKSEIKAGEATVKIVPEEDNTLLPYETKIKLSSGVETVIRREFALSESQSSGDVILFTKTNQKEPELIVLANPENAQVSVDGIVQGFAPYKTSTIFPAEHQIIVKAPGYVDRTVTVRVLDGFRLTVYAKLAKGQEPTDTPVLKKEQLVEILATPTGFLRVRTQPGLKGEEIGQVKPGERYPFLEDDSESGWYKIQFEAVKPGLPDGIAGWVSGEFARKIEIEKEATPAATP
jgi:hypothetical protein